VNEAPDPGDTARVDAEGDLARLQDEIEAARAVLFRLLQDVVVAESRPGNSQAAELLEANEQLVVAALRDQTDSETAAKALTEVSRSAEFDPLTQLPNRVLLLDRFARAIATAKRRGARLALLFLDLNNFKQINDTFGHGVGDEVLKLVAQRLASAIRDADTLSRLGGDEFLILLTEVSHPSDAVLVVDKVIAKLSAPSRVGNHVVRLTASIGISIYPDDGGDAATLIDRADAAMYRAKRHGYDSFAFHGKEPAGVRGREPASLASPQRPVTQHELVVAEHERRQATLRQANEQLVLAVLSAQDLQAAAERAQRRLAEFMALVAKELDSQASPIRVAMTMLGRVRTDEPLLPRVQSIVERQVENMSCLIGAARDVSRANTATLGLEPRPVDMTGIIGAAVDACRPAMDTRLQRFEILMPTCPINVLADPARLAQIVSNLLDNASKYTPEGGQIGLSVIVQGDAVVITVSDSGIGITAQALPEIFEPLVRDITAIGFNGVGLGIGLTVVRALVEAHGGTVGARSAGSGRGSQFIVTLPLAGGSRVVKGESPAAGFTV
jgi:diguanylate cyclase (GGDEF)-like protein